jgi:hypothetical protein
LAAQPPGVAFSHQPACRTDFCIALVEMSILALQALLVYHRQEKEEQGLKTLDLKALSLEEAIRLDCTPNHHSNPAGADAAGYALYQYHSHAFG